MPLSLNSLAFATTTFRSQSQSSSTIVLSSSPAAAFTIQLLLSSRSVVSSSTVTAAVCVQPPARLSVNQLSLLRAEYENLMQQSPLSSPQMSCVEPASATTESYAVALVTATLTQPVNAQPPLPLARLRLGTLKIPTFSAVSVNDSAALFSTAVIPTLTRF